MSGYLLAFAVVVSIPMVASAVWDLVRYLRGGELREPGVWMSISLTVFFLWIAVGIIALIWVAVVWLGNVFVGWGMT